MNEIQFMSDKENINELQLFFKQMLMYLNKNINSKEAYYDVCEFLFNYAEFLYKNTSDTTKKNFYFDIMVEILFSSKYQIKIKKHIYKQFLEKVAEDKYYDILLECYKKYDSLNDKSTIVKILVSYIKPSFLFKSKILTPIHLGRSVEKEDSKSGMISDSDVNWLHNNCISDNDFEGNISDLNRRVGFFTGTYWAWKNYDRLGNPEYFGSFGYRRLLFPNCINDIKKYDFILPLKKTFNVTMKTQIINSLGLPYYNEMFDIVRHISPEKEKNLIEYLNGNSGYYAELYIMKKDLFFKYCEWVNTILNYFINKYPSSLKINNGMNTDHAGLFSQFIGNNNIIPNSKDVRDFAFLIERLTGFYLYELTKNYLYKYKEVAIFEPYIVVPNIDITDYKKIILDKMRENIKRSFRR